MKRYYFIVICVLLLSLIGCTTTPAIEQPKADVPEFSQDEVIAMVKRYLPERRIDGLTVDSSYGFSATYVGDGKWSGTGNVKLEYVEKETGGKFSSLIKEQSKQSSIQYKRITWNFYEKSQTLEILP